MAIDPQYLTMAHVEDFAAIGGERGLEAELRANLERLRAEPIVNYQGVRRLKHLALRRAYERFRDVELNADSVRARAFRVFTEDQAWWLADYALFRALHERVRPAPWTEWPDALRTHHPVALAAARAELADDVCYRQYLQWLASEQWHAARAAAEPVELFGDLPFMVGLDSADVWARQDDFRLDASLGVPPDAFSETGQDWKLPVYKWEVIADGGFEWLRQRARRNAELFGGYRVDHLVGFYRTFWREVGDGARPGWFTPPDEPAQTALGEQVLRVFLDSGAEIVAEDLGVVPDFVRASLARLHIPGCKVFRWERQWHTAGQPFADPLTYPALSMATSGTHDTEAIATWWEIAPDDERAAALAIPLVAERLGPDGCRAALETRTLHARRTRRVHRGAHRVQLGARHPAGGGRLRLDRSHQHARHRERPQLDVADAVAERAAGVRARRGRGRQAAAGMVLAVLTYVVAGLQTRPAYLVGDAKYFLRFDL